MKKSLLAVGIFLLCSSVPVRAADPVQFVPKWELGKRYIYQDRTVTDQSMVMPTGPVNQQMLQTQSFAISVLHEGTDGSREVELKFLTIAMSMKMGEMELSFDSEDELQDVSHPFAQSFKHYAGTTFLLHLNSAGVVVRVDGVEDFLKRLTDGSGASAANMSEMFTEENFRQMYNNLFTQGLPGKPVSVGDIWSIEQQYPMGPSKVNVAVDFTFKGWEDKEGYRCAEITFDGSVAGDIAGVTPVGGLGMSIKDGKVSGRKYFAPEIGQVVSMLNRSEVKMDMELPTPNGPQTTEANMLQTQSVFLLRIEVVNAEERSPDNDAEKQAEPALSTD
ncbi:MAG: hypothetical protein KJ626_07000 [Verrucomicrobia bacterium]|nr:hypothetical protein [Verrucomicrobiota bacterium]